MKLVLISDTHNQHDQVKLPAGDVLVHAGDLTMSGTLSELKSAGEWLQEQPFEHIVAIGGNHDFALEHFMNEGHEQLCRDKFFGRVHYLRDSSVTLNGITPNGVTFYGSPWQPRFFNWAFNVDRGPNIKAHWDKIPQTDVLITHGPPAGVQDWVGRERVGCEDLMDATMRTKPKVHVFGHIHGGYGHRNHEGVDFFNASVVNESYKVVNEPFVVEV